MQPIYEQPASPPVFLAEQNLGMESWKEIYDGVTSARRSLTKDQVKAFNKAMRDAKAAAEKIVWYDVSYQRPRADAALFTAVLPWQGPEDEEKNEWSRFQRKWSEHFSLDSTVPIYSFEEGFLKLLIKEIPGFLTSQEIDFERELIQASTGAFQWGAQASLANWFVDLPSESAETDREWLEFVEWRRRINAQINAMLDEENRREGLPPVAFTQEFFEESRETLRQKRIAYAGWLIQDPLFQKELAELRRVYGSSIEAIGAFPPHPRPHIAVGIQQKYHAVVQELWRFYRRWNLDRMATWDIPVPMHPVQPGEYFDCLDYMVETGRTLHLPWFLQRGDVLDPKKILEQIQLRSAPEHLAGWLKIKKTGSKGLGETAFEQLLRLKRTHTLVIEARYLDRTKRRITKLQHLYAEYFRINIKTVKKHLGRLKEVESAGLIDPDGEESPSGGKGA